MLDSEESWKFQRRCETKENYSCVAESRGDRRLFKSLLDVLFFPAPFSFSNFILFARPANFTNFTFFLVLARLLAHDERLDICMGSMFDRRIDGKICCRKVRFLSFASLLAFPVGITKRRWLTIFVCYE